MSSHPGEMRIVGFGFKDAWHAEAASTELHAMLDVGEGDLLVADVGGDARSVGGHTVVLGGRIRELCLGEAIVIVKRHGGSVLAQGRAAWA